MNLSVSVESGKICQKKLLSYCWKSIF